MANLPIGMKFRYRDLQGVERERTFRTLYDAKQFVLEPPKGVDKESLEVYRQKLGVPRTSKQELVEPEFFHEAITELTNRLAPDQEKQGNSRIDDALSIFESVSGEANLVHTSSFKKERENRRRLNAFHSSKFRAIHGDYQKFLLRRIPRWANLEAIREIYAEAGRRRQAGEDVHVDHIIPLNGENVCGLHVDTNLRIVSAKVNRAKANRLADGPA